MSEDEVGQAVERNAKFVVPNVGNNKTTTVSEFDSLI